MEDKLKEAFVLVEELKASVEKLLTQRDQAERGRAEAWDAFRRQGDEKLHLLNRKLDAEARADRLAEEKDRLREDLFRVTTKLREYVGPRHPTVQAGEDALAADHD